mmetsp:Transcript_127354/g.248102  ORF Transcript_127354/g.248102 Transcript_127354/m.248102 type:complete len:202 (+) Transcript_127354:535-1140(+)
MKIIHRVFEHSHEEHCYGDAVANQNMVERLEAVLMSIPETVHGFEEGAEAVEDVRRAFTVRHPVVEGAEAPRLFFAVLHLCHILEIAKVLLTQSWILCPFQAAGVWPGFGNGVERFSCADIWRNLELHLIITDKFPQRDSSTTSLIPSSRGQVQQAVCYRLVDCMVYISLRLTMPHKDQPSRDPVQFAVKRRTSMTYEMTM